jgi:hypothetical protein
MRGGYRGAFAGRQNRAFRGPEDRTEQLQYLKGLRHNPISLDLRGKEVGTSSTPAEIEARKSEVRYQVQVLQALLTILTDELKVLDQSRPIAQLDVAVPNQS